MWLDLIVQDWVSVQSKLESDWTNGHYITTWIESKCHLFNQTASCSMYRTSSLSSHYHFMIGMLFELFPFSIEAFFFHFKIENLYSYRMLYEIRNESSSHKKWISIFLFPTTDLDFVKIWLFFWQWKSRHKRNKTEIFLTNICDWKRAACK